MSTADKPVKQRGGAKRAPKGTEHLISAMLELRGIPSGADDWTKVANRMPDRPDDSGEKKNQENVRCMWRRLKAKWEDEGIWPRAGEEGDRKTTTTVKVPKAPKATKREKGKEKGKGKAKAAKVQGGKKVRVVGDTEDESGGEGSGPHRDPEEDSDAGNDTVTTNKRKNPVQAKSDGEETFTDDEV